MITIWSFTSRFLYTESVITSLHCIAISTVHAFIRLIRVKGLSMVTELRLDIVFNLWFEPHKKREFYRVFFVARRISRILFAQICLKGNDDQTSYNCCWTVPHIEERLCSSADVCKETKNDKREDVKKHET
jgi:hypothetical protein